jgi:transposase/DNA-binding MarR family transcriptional regulator
MGLVLPPIEAYHVQHLPIVKAYADKIGLVEVINQLVPTEMGIDPGTIVLGMILDTLSGRSPLYRLEEFFAHQDMALLLGRAIAPDAFNDDTVGRILERLYDVGTMKIFTACAVRADQAYGLDKQYVHFDTTSISVYGEYLPPEGPPDQPAPAVPFTITHGYSKDKRPDLKQFVFSTLCVDRAVPLWGKPEDGNASDKTVNTTLLSTIATFLRQHGVAPGAYIYVADAALVTEDNLAALGDTRFITRLPATYSECGRVIAEAVARNQWEDVGVLAHTKPTKHRPATAYKVSEGEVMLYGTTYRAVVVHSSAQDKRRQQRLARDIQTAASTLHTTVRAAEQQEYFCRADAEAAAEKVRALQSSYHHVEVGIEERPTSSPGRPSTRTPRAVKAWRYGLKATLHERSEVIARKGQEAGCFVLLTNVPTEGEMAHSAGEVLRAYKAQHGVEQNFAFLKDPLMVNSLFLKKPERIEALGLVLLLALLLWRLMERQMRAHVERTGRPLTGWDKKPTERPTAFMMMTKFAGVLVCKVGPQRQLARPLSAVQQQYLGALGVSATCFTLPTGSQRTAMAAQRLSRRQKHILQWLVMDHQRTRGIITSSHQDLVRALPGDKGNISHSLQTLEARGLIVIGRSPGRKAESVWLTSEGQKWASQLAGSCD